MFLFKCCEKVVASQFISHMRENKLEEIIQCAYKVGHSTESAQLWVNNDVLCALDDGRCVMLVLLDLSAAFNTVDHGILLSRAVSPSALVFRALPTLGLSLTCPVVHSSSKSEILVLLIVNWPAVFPRGPCWAQSYTWSVPLLSELSCVAMVSGFTCTRTALNCTLTWRPLKWRTLCLRARVEVCLRELNQWMLLNNLRFNTDMTELLVLHAKHRPKPPLDSITVGDATVEPTSSARNIGAVFDDTMSFEEHVNELCRTAFYHIRNISRIRPCLSIDSTKTLVHALVTSRLDHCNSLLYGLPDYLIQRLQYFFMNVAATVITWKRQKIDCLIMSHHYLLSYTGSPSVSILFLRSYCTPLTTV